MNQSEKDIQLRRNLKLVLAHNPNYFGNLSKLDLDDLPKPVYEKVGDTFYEELTCVGFDPDTDVLAAIVRIKQQTGYGGGPCTNGSQEYVRFYLDYGDGVWVDHGVSGFNIHDLSMKGELCYAVPIRIKPRKRTKCHDKPVLPKVRAILSWNNEPPPNQPNWPPIWGNVLKRDIQIDPWGLLIGAVLNLGDLTAVNKIDPAVFEKLKKLVEQQPPFPKPPAPYKELLEKVDSKDELGVLRNVFPALTEYSPTKSTNFAAKALAAFDVDLSKFDDFILEPKFNTTYEELHCVGLDRANSALHGVIQIKRRTGYSGGLCKKGSREYIAFYLDFGSGWEYQGTTSVVVHDIPDIPRSGLWYQASLPVNLEEHQKKWCKTRFARIRGILSWATPPTPNDPDHVAHWGDWEDCRIEIKPLPEGVTPGMFLPFLESIGNMALANIDTAGYATGDAMSLEYSGAKDSPFGGNIQLKGGAFFAPPGPKYKIMLKRPGDPTAQPYTGSFTVRVTTWPSDTSVAMPQTATGDLFNYLPTATVKVADGLLGILKGLDDGEHQVHLEFYNSGGTFIAATAPKTFMVDNTRPKVDVEISSGFGNCGKFVEGDVIEGTFWMEDLHAGHVRLSVTPHAEASGGTLTVTQAFPIAAASPLPGLPIAETGGAGKTIVEMSYWNDTLDTIGVLNGADAVIGKWRLDTTNMKPCGYNIRLWAEDRTIVSGGGIGWEASDIEGFCVE